jgi:putative PEP-CTERM system TPR-repeat lipoprotein
MKLRRALTSSLLALALSSGAQAQSFDSARGYYEDAAGLVARDDAAAALIQLRNALQLDPSHVPSLVLMGQTLLAQGEPGEAAQMLSDALLQGADPTLILKPLTEAYLRQGRYAELLREVPASSAPEDLRAEIFAAHAQAQLALGNIDEAGIALHNALNLEANNTTARIVRVALDIRLGRRQQALDNAGRLIEEFPDDARAWNNYASALHATGQVGPAIEAYRRSLALNPDNTDARVAVVSLYMDQDREADAAADIRYLEENAALDPRGAYFRALAAARSGDRETELNALNVTVGVLDALDPERVNGNPQLQMIGALAHFGLGAYAKARELLVTYLAGNPDDIGANRLLGSTLLALEDYGSAITLLAPLQRRYPDDGDITSLLAAAYSNSGQAQRAADLLADLEDAGSGTRDSDRLLATSLLDAGNTLEATRILERLRERKPGARGVDLPLAIGYLRAENWEAAIESIERLLGNDPDNPNYRNLLGVAELSRGNRDAARDIFTQLLASDQRFLPARVNLARIRLAEGDVASARSLIDTALSLDPESHRAMVERARLHLADDELDDALRWAERAVQASPSTIEYRELLVDIHLQRNAPDAAEQAARRAAADNADDPEGGILLGRTLARVGKPNQAGLTYTRIARDADFNTGILYRIAGLQAAIGAYDSALYSLSNALKGNPRHLPSRLMSVDMELALQRQDMALERAESLVADYPEEARAYLLRGEARLALGDPAAAVADFERARDIDNAPEASLALLRAYRAMGETSRLLPVIKAYYAAGGNDPRLRAAEADLLIAAGDWPTAAAKLDGLINDYPNAAPALNNAAYVLHRLGETERALRYARRAQTLAPESPSVNDTLGWLLVESGDAQAGLGFLREATARAADDPELQYHLGVALHRLNRGQEAKLALRKALRGERDFRDAAAARELLATLEADR